MKKRGRPSKASQVESCNFDTNSIKLIKMQDLTFDDSLFIPIKTKTLIDSILSTEGGIFPGTNTIVIGDPGVGKSTVLLYWIADFQRQGKKV